MGIILAVAIFILILRFLQATGVTPVQALVIAGISTLLVYPVVEQVIANFVGTLASPDFLIILGGLAVLGIIFGVGHLHGRSAGNGTPFNPFN